MNCLLTELPTPTIQQTVQLTDFLQCVYHSHSAAHNGNVATRKDIAAELGALVCKQFPGLYTPTLHIGKYRYSTPSTGRDKNNDCRVLGRMADNI